jgi:glycosyltransferase involved in cell wall biosynthesis
MKIGIDTFACKGGVSGVGVYLSQLLKRIPPSGALYELFGWDFDRYAYTDVAPAMEFTPQCGMEGRTAKSLWYQFKFPQFAVSRKFNACFFPAAHQGLPFTTPCTSVGTIHDMAAFRGTRQTREHLGAVLRMVQPNALRNLDRVIAVSEWVKKELVEVARVKESRIEVVPCGVDTEAFHPREAGGAAETLIEPFSFRHPYILYASRLLHPTKNHIRLIEAYTIFKDKTRLPHRLVFAGDDDHGADRIKTFAAVSKYRNDIFFTGAFPSKSLPELTSGADMIVFPSIYEGFGMGVLEAMASGVPVACANTASLPETAGDAARYFDPFSVEEIADNMVLLASSRDTVKACVAAGIERAKEFSWDKCADKTLRLIQEVV